MDPGPDITKIYFAGGRVSSQAWDVWPRIPMFGNKSNDPPFFFLNVTNQHSKTNWNHQQETKTYYIILHQNKSKRWYIKCNIRIIVYCHMMLYMSTVLRLHLKAAAWAQFLEQRLGRHLRQLRRSGFSGTWWRTGWHKLRSTRLTRNIRSVNIKCHYKVSKE